MTAPTPAKTRPAARASRGAGSEPVWGSGAAPVEPLDDVGGGGELAPPLLEGVVVDDPVAEVEEVLDPLVDVVVVDVDDVGGGVVVVHEVSEDDDEEEEEEGVVDVLDELVDDELVDDELDDVDDVLEELEELVVVDVDVDVDEDPPQPGNCHCCPASHVESAARTSH